MSKKIYSEICVHFGMDSVENLDANRRNRFINRYALSRRYVKCCADSFRLFRCIFDCVCLIYVCCIYFLYHIRRRNRAVYIMAFLLR